MIVSVADTHAAIWYIHSNPALSAAAKAAFDDATARGEQVAISSISLAEIIYLVEKRRIDPTTLDLVLAALDLGEMLVEVQVDRAVALAMRSIGRAEVPDMPDRIIAATALHLGVPVISRDGKIKASSVATIW